MSNWPLRALLLAIFATVGLGPARAEDVKMHSVMAAQLRYNSAHLVTGRILLTTDDPTRRTDIGSNQGDGRKEHLVVNSVGSAVTMAYDYVTPTMDLRLTVDNGNRVSIVRKPVGDSDVMPLTFEQPADGPLRLVVGSGKDERTIEVATLWHLALAEDALCREELFPLLELLRPEWGLASTIDEVVHAMREVARHPTSQRRREVMDWIKDLRSANYSAREQADRNLRAMGADLVPMLRSIDPNSLDAEQTFRIRRILAAMRDAGQEDTVDRVARWMAGDPQAWLALLSHAEVGTRTAAAEQLERLLGEPVDFDPTADPAKRAAQIEDIRGQIRRVWQL